MFGFCYYMCILLLPVWFYWVLFVFYLIGCKIGFEGPCVCTHDYVNNVRFYFKYIFLY